MFYTLEKINIDTHTQIYTHFALRSIVDGTINGVDSEWENRNIKKILIIVESDKASNV